jgi:acetyl esterase/lipase
MNADSVIDTPLSLRARLIRAFVYARMRPLLAQHPTAKARATLDATSNLIWLPRGTTVTTKPLGGIATDWVAHPATGARGFVLYLHGGGYITGSPRTHRGLAARLAKGAKVCVAVPDYRLAPEHPHPAAVDDALAAYRGLLEQGIPPNKIIIAGDSAGGGLSLALALRLKAVPLPQPAGLVLLSPFTDITFSGGSMQDAQQKDWLLTREWMHEAAKHYGGGQDPKQPTLSPLYGDLTGLPPTLIQVGGDEYLRDDSTRITARAREQGVAVALEVWQRLWHVWQLHAGQIPEADDAVASICRFIHARLTGKL